MRAAILEAVQTGKISMQRLDEAVRRVLTLKQKYNLFGWEPLNPQMAPQRVNTEEHTATVQTLYRNTVAIAKDQYKMLPLTADKTILLVFPGAFPATQRECIALNPNVRSLAYSLNPTETEIASAKIEARRADVVVVFTYNIPEYAFQADLVNVVPPEKAIVVALESPYDIEQNINPAGYVTSFNVFPGAFKAACEVLFGVYPPHGKWKLPN
jgi:beta-N-acetylhexosaminidase